MQQVDTIRDQPDGRRLSYVGFAAVVIVYLAIIQGGGLLIGNVTDVDDSFVTSEDVILNMWIPIGAALLFTYGVVGWLGWWRPVMRDDLPVQRWVRIVPVILVVSILIAIDYADILDKSFGYILALLVATQMVGWGEEGMFRGIGVTTLRRHGLTEGKVALWSSLIFGAVHLTNAIGRGTAAIPQALAVSFAGYFFYLTRRVVGRQRTQLDPARAVRLLDPHRHRDPRRPSRVRGIAAAILAYAVIAIVLLARRHQIEPKPA